MSFSKPCCFALLSAAMLASACSKNSEPSADNAAPSAAPATPAPAVAAKPAAGDGIFKYTITTDIAAEGDQIEILVAMNSVESQYPVKYDLDCEGDGEFEHKGLTENKKCIYKKNSGTHQIWVRGEIPGMFLCAMRPEDVDCGATDIMKNARAKKVACGPHSDHSKEAVVSIDSWGNVPWKSMQLFAAQCHALNKLPEDSPDLSQVKDMSEMFFDARSFNQPLEKWNVANVTNLLGMFWGAKSFNQPLEAWDVTNVTDMYGMFYQAEAFNQPIEKWNVSNVTDMGWMFEEAKSFNQPLEKWNVSKVTNMSEMFSDAKAFNQPLEAWNIANVTNIHSMFSGASAFNQPLEKWDVSKISHLHWMFSGASAFNQPLEAWNVSNVTDMYAMFKDASAFNQPLEKWNVSNVTRMGWMFKDAKAFSHYPKSWVVPADALNDMFEGSNVEAEAKKSPLKTK